MDTKRLQELAGIQLNEGKVTSNFSSMVEDMKRLMSKGKTIKLIAKESHISDKYKGEIFDYTLTSEDNTKLKEGFENEHQQLIREMESYIKYLKTKLRPIELGTAAYDIAETFQAMNDVLNSMKDINK